MSCVVSQIQKLRRCILKHKKEVLQEFHSDKSKSRFKQILSDPHHPWRLSASEIDAVNGDVEGDDAQSYVHRLQFSDFYGELDDFADELFKKFDGVADACVEKDSDDSGSLVFDAFESALTGSGVEAEKVEVRDVASSILHYVFRKASLYACG